MKNKLLCIILSIAIAATGVGCGESSEANSNQTDSKSDEGPDSIAEEDSVDNEPDSLEEDEPVNEKEFEEISVVDNDECTIKITGIEPDSMWGYTLNVNLENKSEDKTYMFSVDSASVNGVQSDPFFATEVAAGKKSNNEISFSDESLKENGIEEFTDIELSFRVYDSENWEAKDVAKETVHVYPLGEDKAEVFKRDPESSDVAICDNEKVTATVIGYRNDEIWGYTVDLFLENKTDKPVTFSVEDASVNGYMSDPFWATSVSGGKCAFSSISWGSEELEENGITDVEEIEFVFNSYDEESMNDYFKEKITLNP